MHSPPSPRTPIPLYPPLPPRLQTPFLGAYSATKAAVESLSHSLRLELSPFGVKVVYVAPGSVLTNFKAHSHFDSKFVDTLKVRCGARRFVLVVCRQVLAFHRVHMYASEAGARQAGERVTV